MSSTWSHIIDNPAVENGMTDKFVCVVYHRERINVEVLRDGIDPLDIWRILGYEAYHENVVPIIVDRFQHFFKFFVDLSCKRSTYPPDKGWRG